MKLRSRRALHLPPGVHPQSPQWWISRATPVSQPGMEFSSVLCFPCFYILHYLWTSMVQLMFSWLSGKLVVFGLSVEWYFLFWTYSSQIPDSCTFSRAELFLLCSFQVL